MARYVLSDRGNVTDEDENEEQKKKKKKKKKGSEYVMGDDGIIRLSTQDIAPVKVEHDSFFKSGALADGYHVGDLSLSLLATAGDTALNVVKGAGSMVEGVTDLLLYGASGLSDLVGADSFADDLKDLAKKSSVNDLLSGAEGITDKYSFFGDKMDSVSQGLGQVGTIILTGGVAGAAGLGAGATTAITTGAMGLSSMGSGMSEAYQANASDEDAFVYGLSKGVIDAGSELIFGGLGKVVNAVGISKGLSSLDDIFAKKLASKLSRQTAKNLVEFGVKASAEGFEEVLAGVGTAAAKHFTYMSDEELSKLLKDEKLLDQFVIGAVTSGISQSGIVPGMKSGSLAEANKTGHDFVTGLTKNEQTVVDKVYADEVAKAEKKGKLSAKEKNKIYDDVLNDLEKGYIKTETIEEVLGGKTYKAYQDTVSKEESLAKQEKALSEEFQGLNKMVWQEMTGEQHDRREELRTQLSQIRQQIQEQKKNPARDQLKQQLGREVSELVKQERLGESYAERGRRAQAFQADVSQYDERQRATVQAAIDSGILNNTRRAHEFVDLVAKISADKGVAFNFADNKKLQETGFALEGVTVNGFVNSNGVTVNVNSAKALNSVVGHEIAHVLEGTELYDGLQTAITQYAESKGDYKTRLAQLTKLYEGKEGYTGEDAKAKIQREVVADLVGDYLFTDKEFVSRLSTENRTVFEKIFDEVKYLCRIATAGSKEARQLEKVKKAFEEAYRAEGTKNPTGDGGMRYALGDIDYPRKMVDFNDTNGRRIAEDETVNALIQRGKVTTISKDSMPAELSNVNWGEKTEARAAIKVILKEFLGEDVVFNLGENSAIAYLTSKGLDHTLAGENTKEKAVALSAFYELISNAEYSYSGLQDPHSKTIGREDWDYFVSVAEIEGGGTIPLVFAVRTIDQDVRSQIYSIATKKNLAIPRGDGTQGKPANAHPSYGDSSSSGDIVEQNGSKVKSQFSLSSAENVKAAEQHFGITYKISEAGYLLTDGRLLDFSGRHEGGPGGYRTVDHRDITDALGDDYGDDTYSGGMIRFMGEGNIRLSPESGGINLSVKPNKAQLSALDRYISNFRGEVILDIDDENGNTVVSVEYPKRTYSKRIINDINAYFDNGTIPEPPSSIGQFLSLSEQKKQEQTDELFPLPWTIKGEDVGLQEFPLPEGYQEQAGAETSRDNGNVLEFPLPQGYGDHVPSRDNRGPVREDIVTTEASKTDEGMFPLPPRYQKTTDKQRKWVGTSTASEVVDGKVVPGDLDQELTHYQPISNKKTLGNANAKLSSLGYEDSLVYFRGRVVDQKVGLDDIALGERLIQEAVKKGDYETAGDLIMDISILGTELGQKVQALSIIKRLTPEGQLKMLQKTVERGKAKGDKAFDGVEITQDMVKTILETSNGDGTYDQNALNGAVERVKQQIADQMKVTAWDYINEWRYLSMLGNPKTHIRNMLSNVAMTGTRVVKNAIARTIEDIAPVQNRTRTWESASDEVKAFAKQAATEAYKSDADSKYSDSGSIKAKRKILKTQAGNWLANANSNALSWEDTIFSKFAYRRALQEYLTANGIRTQADIAKNSKLVAEAKKYAMDQAKEATFQQDSYIASKISEIERRSPAWGVAIGSTLPFKKTPVNIAKTAAAYSPLGFARNIYDAVQVKNGNMEVSEAIDHLAQTLTGTSLSLIGYALASMGILNGAGEDDKEGKYDYQLGEQSYSVTLGNSTYSLSWLSPVAMPLFVGVNAYEQLVEGKEWDANMVFEALGKTLDPMSEMSFLSSLDDVLSSYDSGAERFLGIFESMGQNYISQFIPTVSSQIAATFDDTKRTTKPSADSGFTFGEETARSLMYKIPGLRNMLEPSTDIWGNEVKQSGNLLTRAAENFLAPYSWRENIASEVDSEIKELYSQTGDSGLIPSVPYSYVSYKGEKYEMSAEEFTDYKKTYGQTAYDLMEKLFTTATYRNADNETKADMVSKVYDHARDEAKKMLLDGRDVTYTNATSEGVEYYKENPIVGAIEHDMSVGEYELFSTAPRKYALAQAVGGYGSYKVYQEALGKIESDKDEDGNTVADSKKAKVIDYINSLDAEYGEKIILYVSKYPSKESRSIYGYEIVDYLNGRSDISYSQMVAILLELGFKVSADGRVTWD